MKVESSAVSKQNPNSTRWCPLFTLKKLTFRPFSDSSILINLNYTFSLKSTIRTSLFGKIMLVPQKLFFASMVKRYIFRL